MLGGPPEMKRVYLRTAFGDLGRLWSIAGSAAMKSSAVLGAQSVPQSGTECITTEDRGYECGGVIFAGTVRNRPDLRGITWELQWVIWGATLKRNPVAMEFVGVTT